MNVDKQLIRNRKAMYGDNFECIAKKWACEPETVCTMMAAMKQCRIDAIKEKMKGFPSPDLYLKLEKALQDSEDDMANYRWIANNYAEYQKL